MVALDGWRFCPRCRGELEGDARRLDCRACGFVAFANSKPTASALCVDERGRVLLGRRAHEPQAGLWDLPGGYCDEGEHPLETLRRELLEETGLEVEPLELFGVWMDLYESEPPQSTLNLVWRARVVGGTERPADDVVELRWFRSEELPPREELAFRMVDGVLAAWREGSPGAQLRPPPPANAGG